jgi:hypothetical protein
LNPIDPKTVVSAVSAPRRRADHRQENFVSTENALDDPTAHWSSELAGGVDAGKAFTHPASTTPRTVASF